MENNQEEWTESDKMTMHTLNIPLGNYVTEDKLFKEYEETYDKEPPHTTADDLFIGIGYTSKVVNYEEGELNRISYSKYTKQNNIIKYIEFNCVRKTVECYTCDKTDIKAGSPVAYFDTDEIICIYEMLKELEWIGGDKND